MFYNINSNNVSPHNLFVENIYRNVMNSSSTGKCDLESSLW